MKVKQAVGVLAVIGCAGYLSYRLLLLDTAKRNLMKALESTQEAYEELKQILNAQSGERSGREARINRSKTEEQWSNLGY